jgi:hypothetical protein
MFESYTARRQGTYPRGTVNYLVDKKLKGMAERLKGFYAEEKNGTK